MYSNVTPPLLPQGELHAEYQGHPSPAEPGSDGRSTSVPESGMGWHYISAPHKPKILYVINTTIFVKYVCFLSKLHQSAKDK